LSVQISVQDAKPLDLKFLKTDTINEVFQTIDVVPEVHHHTSYNLLYQSKILDSSTLLADLLSSVNQKNLHFEMKSKAYDEKAMMEHIAKVRDIVGLNEPENFGVNSGVSKINDLNLAPIPDVIPDETKNEEVKEEKDNEDGENGENSDNKKESKPAPPAPTDQELAQIKESVSDFFGKLPSNYFTPTSAFQPAVRALYLSAWNPVPFNYKTKGHLAYIVLQTLESDIVHITGSTSGFYINKSTSNKFDPTPRDISNKSFTLYDLIVKTSKNFTNQMKSNNEKLNKVDPVTFLRPQTTFLKNPWITKASNPTPDFGKTQFEDHTQRDFNDEYQSIKDFPTQNVSDRIVRERLLAKTSFEFTENAVKGALSVLNGGIQPMNPTEDRMDQIFLHNGIFYSFGVDASGFFESKGGNHAARAAANQDLKAIKFWNTIDARGIYTLLTTIVDYAGRRVVCQTPVPGLFTSSEPKEVKNEETGEIDLVDGEPLTSIDYGYDEATDSFKSSPEFVEGLEPIRKAMHYKRVKLEKGENAEAVTNSEIKGMFGTDKRKYVLDLYNTTPLDTEFIKEHYHPESEDSYPHKQTVVRIEAVQEWYAHNAREMVKKEAKEKNIDLSAPLKEGEEPPTITIDDDKLVFTPDASETDENAEKVSKFIKEHLIPKFLDQYDSISNLVPVDGAYLTSNMHKFGINLRYMGYLAQEVERRIKSSSEDEAKTLEENAEINKAYDAKMEAKKRKKEEKLRAQAEAIKNGEELPKDDKEEEKEEEEKEEDDDEADSHIPVARSRQYEGLYAIIIQELIARASKHILRNYSQELPISLNSSLVSHFHNCLLGQELNSEPKAEVEDAELYTAEELSFTKLTPKSILELIAKDVKLWYRFDLPTDWNVKFVRPKLVQREIALKFGIQWQQREYYFTKDEFEEAQKKTVAKDKKSKKAKSSSPAPATGQLNVFSPEDVSFAPLIKDSINHSVAAEQIFEHGRTLVLGDNTDKREEGLALITEAIAVYEQVYGPIHPEVAKIYATLSQVYQDIGLKREAALLCRKAVAVNERVFGLDSHDTIVSLLNLAFLEAHVGNYPNALKVYCLITQIWSTVYNTQHVSIATLISNSTIYLQDLGLYKIANRLLEKLINLSTVVHGDLSYTTGFLRFRHAFLLAQEEMFDESLKEAKKSNEVIRSILTYKHYVAKQTAVLVSQLSHYKFVIDQNKKIEQQKLKQSTREKIASTNANGKNPNQFKTLNNDKFANKSVDEVLEFVLGNGSSSSKKNKKKTGSKK